MTRALPSITPTVATPGRPPWLPIASTLQGMDAKDVAAMTAEALNSLGNRIDERMDQGFRQIEDKIEKNQRALEGKIEGTQRALDQRMDQGFRQILAYLEKR